MIAQTSLMLVKDDSNYDFKEPKAPPPATKAKKTKKVHGKIEWPFEISINLGADVKPKIAFWSGEDRKYYPENPGHSKLAQVFVASSHKGDTPAPTYTPPPIGVNKPVSRLGYGIGGLLVPRFKLHTKTVTSPGPGYYQRPENCTCARSPTPKFLAFGSVAVFPRFERPSSFKPPGPGSYQIDETTGGCKEFKLKSVFGSKRCLTRTTATVCTMSKGESCTVCGQEQLFDYYRSKVKISHPDATKPEIVILCRKCYCVAWHDQHDFWNSKRLASGFQKCRHCSYFHEHRNLPLVLNKTWDFQIKKLSAKECIFAKYFSDGCKPVMKQ